MADEFDLKKISQLPAATTPGNYDVLAGVQGPDTKQFSFAVILAWLQQAVTATAIGAVPQTRQINGHALTADLTLTPADLGAQPLITAAGLLKGNGSGGISAAGAGTDYGTYSKPAGGIPASDLASGVIPTVPAAYASNPAMDGTASPGSSDRWARGDHVHPSDTSKQDALTFDSTPVENSLNPVTSGGVYSAIRVRNPQVTLFNTLTDVHTDTTVTMADDFTNYKFLGVVFNSRSPAASARRIILLLSTNLIPQGGFYPIMNDEVSGYVRINYVSGQNKQIRFQATNISTLYLTNILGIY